MPFLLSSFLIIGLSVTFCANQPTVLPGHALVGQAFRILEGEPVGQIFNFMPNDTTLDGKYRYDGRSLLLADNMSCSILERASVTKTYEEFCEVINSHDHFSGKFGKFSGSYSSTHQMSKEILYSQNQVIGYAYGKCTTHTITLIPELAEFKSSFLEVASNLPEFFNEMTKHVFFQFIENYGDHVVSSCDVGGSFQQEFLINSNYIKNHGIEAATHQVGAAFFISVGGSTSSENEVSEEFRSNSVWHQVECNGGNCPANEIANWIDSIQNSKNPSCASRFLMEISDFFLFHPALQRKHEAIKQAVQAFFNRSGCMNPHAPNFDQKALMDDGSCQPVFIPDCFHLEFSVNPPQGTIQRIGPWVEATHGSIYQVQGPDSNGFCHTAFAYAEGTTSSSTSPPMRMFTSKQYLEAHRSNDFCRRYGKEHAVRASTSGGSCEGRWGCISEVHNQGGTSVQLSVFNRRVNPSKGCNFAAYAVLKELYQLTN